MVKRKEKRRKDKDYYEVVEEVFDTPTLLALYHIIRGGYINKMFGVVSAGKEARVYWAKNRRGEDVAVKIYLTTTAEFRKSIRQYIIGDPRFESVSGDLRKLILKWVQKEYKNLKRMYEAGIRVPKPYYAYRNILVMEFIGENGIRAPLLKEVRLTDEEYVEIYEKIVYYMKLMYNKAKLVHADLSEYNIMLYDGEPVIIDVSQAVTLDHPMAMYFLLRDIKNIIRYFRDEVGIETHNLNELLEEITGKRLE
ncbi:MAG: serine/threonine protein kinase [Desulfurococcales archaeon ex4484_217_1]|nr:MAG: serine/threonine protein kinase [Desulfurococcales archaeon ex4484_217_1]